MVKQLRAGSVGKSTCHQAWWLSSIPINLHSGKKEQAPESWPLISTYMPWNMHKCTHPCTFTLDKQVRKFSLLRLYLSFQRGLIIQITAGSLLHLQISRRTQMLSFPALKCFWFAPSNHLLYQVMTQGGRLVTQAMSDINRVSLGFQWHPF